MPCGGMSRLWSLRGLINSWIPLTFMLEQPFSWGIHVRWLGCGSCAVHTQTDCVTESSCGQPPDHGAVCRLLPAIP